MQSFTHLADFDCETTTFRSGHSLLTKCGTVLCDRIDFSTEFSVVQSGYAWMSMQIVLTQ